MPVASKACASSVSVFAFPAHSYEQHVFAFRLILLGERTTSVPHVLHGTVTRASRREGRPDIAADCDFLAHSGEQVRFLTA